MTKRVILASIACTTVALMLLVISQMGSHAIPQPRETYRKQTSTEYLWENASPTSDHARLFSVVDDYLKGLPAGANVVDLGCGNGAYWRDYAAAAGSCRASICPPRGSLSLNASGLISALRLPTPPAIWPFSVGTYDAVISTDVIEHVFLPRLFAANCRRLLKPTGTLVISTPYHGYAKNLGIALTGEWDRHHDPLWDYGHIKFWSVRTLSELLFEAGFQGLEWRGAGRFPLFWNEMIIRARVAPRGAG